MIPSAELLLRLDRAGPRYTSYPTVPSWTESFADADLDAAIVATPGPLQVYVHVPFCREQCWFCGCNQVVSGRVSAGDRYLDALERELARLPLGSTTDVLRIHLGGGTPTWLSRPQMDRLYQSLYARFRPVAGAELSVEVDPDVTDDAQLDQLAGYGVNRISVGVQSTDPRVLAAINRPQVTGRIRAVMERARAHGMRGLNVDLIYGLPYQDPENLATTLDDILALAPDRLAVYSYAHVPWLKAHQRKIDEAALPGPVEKMGLFLQARERLLDAGFVDVGMDHFARPDDELAVASRERRLHRNFMGYTTLPDVPLLGLGVSAISELGGTYAQLQHHLGTWYRAVETGEQPRVARGIRLTDEDRLRKDVIGALMCNFEIVKAAIEGRHRVAFDDHFGPALARLAPLVDDGLVELAPDRIGVTPLGRFLVRNVAMAFDDRLTEGRFSKTV